MYQFMVATRSGASFVNSSNPENPSPGFATGSEVPTMSLSSGTNKWASRAVVALQLAAWSAVGIVLLEKGIASLKKSNAANDDSRLSNPSQLQVISTRAGNAKEPMVGSGDVLSVIPLVPFVSNVPTTEVIDFPESTTGSSARSRLVGSLWAETTETPMGTKVSMTVLNGPNTPGSLIGEVDTGIVPKEGQDQPVGDGTDSAAGNRKYGQSNGLNELNPKENDGRNFEDAQESTKTPADPATTKPALENPGTGSGWSATRGKRVKIAQMGEVAGGAAAAVAMVAVGAVMLVLGPAVIVLRAIDERRQERRFLKLSGEEDLPPSYEQATGTIEQAPTYSSLNLDVIPPEAGS